jgi:hypothetical protein
VFNDSFLAFWQRLTARYTFLGNSLSLLEMLAAAVVLVGVLTVLLIAIRGWRRRMHNAGYEASLREMAWRCLAEIESPKTAPAARPKGDPRTGSSQPPRRSEGLETAPVANGNHGSSLAKAIKSIAFL